MPGVQTELWVQSQSSWGQAPRKGLLPWRSCGWDSSHNGMWITIIYLMLEAKLTSLWDRHGGVSFHKSCTLMSYPKISVGFCTEEALSLCSGWATPADTVLWVAIALPPAKWVDEIGRDVVLQAVVSTVTTSKLNRRCACRWVTSVALMSHGEELFRQQCAFSLHWDSWIHCNGVFTAHHWEGRN